MKNQLLSLAAILSCGMLFAQTTTVPNFTLTSSTGQKFDLYVELNKGKTIVLDLWYNECGWCQSYAPTVEQAYTAHGSGTGNIDFWGINTKGQSDASINTYKTTYGVSNKCFGGTASTNAKSKTFLAFNPGGGSYGTPAYVVVCPNKKGWWNVNKPPTATGFDTYFTQCGALGVNNIVDNENQTRFVSIYPNPGNNESKIDFFMAERSHLQITVFNILGEQIAVLASETYDTGMHTINFSGSLSFPAGNYLIKMTTDNGISDIAKFVVTY